MIWSWRSGPRATATRLPKRHGNTGVKHGIDFDSLSQRQAFLDRRHPLWLDLSCRAAATTGLLPRSDFGWVSGQQRQILNLTSSSSQPPLAARHRSRTSVFDSYLFIYEGATLRNGGQNVVLRGTRCSGGSRRISPDSCTSLSC